MPSHLDEPVILERHFEIGRKELGEDLLIEYELDYAVDILVDDVPAREDQVLQDF